ITHTDTLPVPTQPTTISALLGPLSKQVQVDDGTLGMRNGQVPKASYALDAGAQQVTATVRNASGEVVRVVELGAQDAGTHDFTFDGKGADGHVLADGSYKLEIDALAPGAKAPTQAAVTTFATVDAVDRH